MAAKQSKIWAYIIAFLLLVILGLVAAFFLFLKPRHQQEIKGLTDRLNYTEAVRDSIKAAKQRVDTIEIETIVNETQTIIQHDTVQVTNEVGEMSTIYSSTFQTPYFSLPYKIRARRLDRITFLPYTIKSIQIEKATMVNCPELPEASEVSRNALWLSLSAGLNGLAIETSLIFQHRKGWGVGVGHLNISKKHLVVFKLQKKIF